MNYKSVFLASNDHKELQEVFNEWLKIEKPQRIFETKFVADGAEFTYCTMVLYAPGPTEKTN